MSHLNSLFNMKCSCNCQRCHHWTQKPMVNFIKSLIHLPDSCTRFFFSVKKIKLRSSKAVVWRQVFAVLRNLLFIPVYKGLNGCIFVFFCGFTLRVKVDISIGGLQLLLSQVVHLLFKEYIIDVLKFLLVNLITIRLIFLLSFQLNGFKFS